MEPQVAPHPRPWPAAARSQHSPHSGSTCSVCGRRFGLPWNLLRPQLDFRMRVGLYSFVLILVDSILQVRWAVKEVGALPNSEIVDVPRGCEGKECINRVKNIAQSFQVQLLYLCVAQNRRASTHRLQ